MKLDEAKLAASLPDLGEHVKRTLAAKGPLPGRLASLRGVGAPELASVIAAVAEAIIDKPTKKSIATTTIRAPFVHHGDLVVKGNLKLVAPFFVTGNLRVSGVVSHVGPDSFAAIHGDVHVGSLLTSGEFACGEIFAKGIVYGHYNDNTLACGTINARIVIADEHDIQHAGVRADLYLDIDAYAQGFGPRVTAKLKQHLLPVFFARDLDEGKEVLDHHALFAALAHGKRAFLPQKQPPKRRLRY